MGCSWKPKLDMSKILGLLLGKCEKWLISWLPPNKSSMHKGILKSRQEDLLREKLTRTCYSGGTFERSRFSANFGTLKQGPASVLFSRLLRPNNSAAAALQLAAPVLQYPRSPTQRMKLEFEKTLKDIQQLDKPSPRTLRL